MKRDQTRERILEAAFRLLADGGRDALSTRAICAESGVQSPAIYRIFGDKQGLIDAVAGHGFESYLAEKASVAETGDPVADLRQGWDMHVGFGLANPALYSLIYGDARPGAESPAAQQAGKQLAKRVKRIAEAGRLRVSEHRAVHLIHSAGCGMTFTLIAIPEHERDPALSPLAREAAIAAVTTDSGAPAADEHPVSPAVALRAAAPELTALSAGERTLLTEWLDRIATAPPA